MITNNDAVEWVANNPGFGVVTIQTMPDGMEMRRFGGRLIMGSSADLKWLAENCIGCGGGVGGNEHDKASEGDGGGGGDGVGHYERLAGKIGEKAYADRKKGLKWKDIAMLYGRDQFRVLNLAKAYAKRHGMEWPVKYQRIT
jgi:hypothetical protein